ncbi:MAG: siroheme synthase CysG [Methylomonas sp.]|jgi:uroporphyrin-III C-methyltransferase/precorrin-2 dehydrogenase/sirohydrochlorin ferrochelatase|uniref:siroheme synthase CysG n=1 Tax=Methylomonas sp. TaxID=418 RepID=UPI0025DEAE42|nr:siroheme synthase CysG [Methylomonas sp.]MCK9609214.1 siroheme synthase CysG [Methylomonas sp.]
MEYFPLFLKVKDQTCLVVGAGEIAARKIELLIRAGANIVVVATEIGNAVSALQRSNPIVIRQKAFTDEDIDGMGLVVSATNCRVTNIEVSKLANQRKIPVNVVDDPALCSFIFPAIIDRSPLLIAISSSGVSPVLTRLLRARVESAIPASFGLLVKLAEKFKLLVKQRIPQPTQRRVFWEKILQGPVAELVFVGKQSEAEELFQSQLRQVDPTANQGEVYLIGAGPGDPDLLTFKALRLLQQADVIVYDRLVSIDVLDMARRDAEKIYVGKQRDNHSLPQESINQLLIDLALAGKRVARLKGGDPFIFGRGGEEIESLIQLGIRFQVVPGITAAAGCASYAGIPLTHRDHAQSCTFVTGHLKDGSINLDWQQLSRPNQTVVIYMGLAGLATICRSLMAHGCPADHPIAVIQQGTTRNQRVLTGTLVDMPSRVEQAEMTPPTLIIVGSVVTLHQQLDWFQMNL